MEDLGFEQKWALLIAHPGHELRIHHWLELTKPITFVLTDGSGQGEHSRLSSTHDILKKAGSAPGNIFGKFTDTDLYTIILEGHVDLLRDLTQTLSMILLDENITAIAGDALEGYNPSHDLGRHIINTAVNLVKKKGKTISNFDFPLYGDPAICPEHLQASAITLKLNEAELHKKVSTAKNYPELIHEVNSALHHIGEKAFATECLRPAEVKTLTELSKTKPMYETYGAIKVALGQYKHAIGFNNHMRPLMEKLWSELDLI